MDRLTMQTTGRTEENFRKLAQLFPSAVTETVAGYDKQGRPILTRAIDFDVLQQETGVPLVKGPDERYQFTWPDKAKARAAAGAPTSAALRPQRAESLGRDGTPGGFNSENLYIEGDNLDVLNLLRETYRGKVDMIYIDPPYNTGSDLIYRDDFVQGSQAFAARTGQRDDQGRLLQNPESSGRFHTDWLNMIFPRLLLARDLLADSGVIFLSIDDNEVENLKKVCHEVFGPANFIGQWNWFKSATPPNLSKKIKKNIEYILCYEKSRTPVKYQGVRKESPSSNGLLNQTNSVKTLVFPARTVDSGLPDGVYPAGRYGTENYQIDLLKDARVKKGVFTTQVVLRARFKWGQSKLQAELDAGTKISIRTKAFSPSYAKEYDPEIPPNFIDKGVGVDTTERAGQLLTGLMGVKVFDYPKPVELITYLAGFCCPEDGLIMDFFSGSATTAHAVMQLNAEDGGRRRFLLVQWPEETEEGSEVRRAGYRNLCEIGRARIRRAGERLRAETGAEIDYGFRALRLDSSNMKEVYYTPGGTDQAQLFQLQDNIKGDRTPEDLLFQVMLELGIPLSSPIERLTLGGKTVFDVDGNTLLACFGATVGEDTALAAARRKPRFFVLRDCSMASDAMAVNLEQIFAAHSPHTTLRVL